MLKKASLVRRETEGKLNIDSSNVIAEIAKEIEKASSNGLFKCSYFKHIPNDVILDLESSGYLVVKQRARYNDIDYCISW